MLPLQSLEHGQIPSGQPITDESSHPPAPPEAVNCEGLCWCFLMSSVKAETHLCCSLVFPAETRGGSPCSSSQNMKFKTDEVIHHPSYDSSRKFSLPPPQWVVFPREALCSDQLHCDCVYQISLVPSHFQSV